MKYDRLDDFRVGNTLVVNGRIEKIIRINYMFAFFSERNSDCIALKSKEVFYLPITDKEILDIIQQDNYLKSFINVKCKQNIVQLLDNDLTNKVLRVKISYKHQLENLISLLTDLYKKDDFESLTNVVYKYNICDY